MSRKKTEVEVKGACEVVMTRVFAAPRERVWEAMSKPEYVRRWYGLKVLTLTVCEMDHRVGGRWRFVLRDPGGTEHGFTGEYREILRPERVVYTENYEAMGPGHEIVVTTTFVEVDGETTLTSRLQYHSQADRDGHLQSGMDVGANESHDRLAEVLASFPGVAS